jgi:lipoyl(octanoyl) transferase
VTPALPLQIRRLGRRDYHEVWRAMQRFAADRRAGTAAELWLLEHPPVFTLGQAGRETHLLDPGDIPVVRSDRGGQVTYHGPGQLVCYLLLDLQARGIGIRTLVSGIETAVMALLSDYGISAERRQGAPGVYVDGAKIAAIGLRVKKQCTYHGLSLNVAMDLHPFERINPCGYAGMPVTDMAAHGVDAAFTVIADKLAGKLAETLGYTVDSVASSK